jgi:hypothetical protein
MSNFYEMVGSAIRQALPNNWKFVSSEKLLGVEPCKVQYAFQQTKKK